MVREGGVGALKLVARFLATLVPVAALVTGVLVAPGGGMLVLSVTERSDGPDPTRLPTAIASRDAESTNGALHRETPRAGDAYRDPHTGAVVLRLTDPTFPVGNEAAAGADYSNGGPFVSQVWEEDGRAFVTVVAYLYHAPRERHWAIDVDLEAHTLHDPRALPLFDADTAQAWSLDADTPRMWYCVQGGELRRFDTARMDYAERGERFGHFPVDPPDERLARGAWL